MADPAGLAKYILQAIAENPQGVAVEHIWTPEVDLIFLRVTGAARRRLREEDLAAVARIVERLAAEGDRQVVVDIR